MVVWLDLFSKSIIEVTQMDDKEIERMIIEYCHKTDCMKCHREESNEHPCFTIALGLGDVKQEDNKNRR